VTLFLAVLMLLFRPNSSSRSSNISVYFDYGYAYGFE